MGCCNSNRKFMPLTITTVGGIRKQVVVPASFTGRQLKETIFEKLCQELEVDMMALTSQNIPILDSTKLENIGSSNESFIIKQEKVKLQDLQNILPVRVYPQEQDEVYCEKGLALMPCGHKIGRNTMFGLLNSITSENSREFQIKCPIIKGDGQMCKAVWDYRLCKKVGVFTKEEAAKFEEGLSRNWIKVFSKKCPNCSQTVTRKSVEEKWVRCTSCSGQDFCFKCLDPYRNNQQCQSCVNIALSVNNTPIDRVFSLNVIGVKRNFNTPRRRMCPRCGELIEHGENCKHMECFNCHQNFCWVCLSTPINAKWPCGGAHDYCGRVAEVQRY